MFGDSRIWLVDGKDLRSCLLSGVGLKRQLGQWRGECRPPQSDR